MAWSYRKRIKIAPGVHVNVSKSGISTSVGTKGASVTLGPKGTYVYTGIPGTGLYSRKKISGNTSNTKNNPYNHSLMDSSENNNAKNGGCRMWCGIAMLIFFICQMINWYISPASNFTDHYVLAICTALVEIAIINLLLRPWINRKKTGQTPQEESSVVSSLFSTHSDSTVCNFGYDYVISQYNQAEKKAVEKSDSEINQAKQMLDSTINENKKTFLQSFISCVKYDRLNRLYIKSHYDIDKATDELDPLFEQAARKIVATQKFSITDMLDWFGYDLDIDRQILIERQLQECGIIEQEFDGSNLKILVKDIKHLNAIIRKANGKTLLPITEKIKVNEYLETRKSEIIGDNKPKTALEGVSDNLMKSYQNFLKAYKSLTGSKTIWEVVSIQQNLEAKSSASTLIDRKTLYDQYSKNFCFVQPANDSSAAYFNFKNSGVEFYIYPEYVVIARANMNFDVVPFADFEITYKKSNFVEESTILLPKDAKLVKFTYKHVNRNGERDARYSDNPRYGVYEYGNLTFKPLGMTMQFSNSEVAENFVRAFSMLKAGTTVYTDPVFGVTEKYFNDAKDVTKALTKFYDTLDRNRAVMRVVDNSMSDENGSKKEKLRILFLGDLIRCYEHLGHDSTNLFTKEGLPMMLAEAHTLSDVDITFEMLAQCKGIVESICDISKDNKDIFFKNRADDFFFINEVLKTCNQKDLITQYFSLLYRFFSVVAKADGTITDEESTWLENLMSYSQGTSNHVLDKFEQAAGIKVGGTKTLKKQEGSSSESEENIDPLTKLQDLIGLEEVKKEVTALANFVKIQKEREKKGLKAVGLSCHCVFTGNPGTGKTTVARIVAEIYKSLGLLKKGHLVETDRSGLVAEYVGQTAVKTNKIIDSALDGVLFIDEAYSLVQGGGNDYGNEAISTLLKRMEDERNRLVVILAGYGNEMKNFIDSNPGLQSRFNRYIHFEDYNVDDLKNIFLLNAKNNQYNLTPEALEVLVDTLTYAIEHKDKNFGNGRFIRNLFEKSLQNQAVRLSCLPQTTAEDLSTLTINDIPSSN